MSSEDTSNDHARTPTKYMLRNFILTDGRVSVSSNEFAAAAEMQLRWTADTAVCMLTCTDKSEQTAFQAKHHDD